MIFGPQSYSRSFIRAAGALFSRLRRFLFQISRSFPVTVQYVYRFLIDVCCRYYVTVIIARRLGFAADVVDQSSLIVTVDYDWQDNPSLSLSVLLVLSVPLYPSYFCLIRCVSIDHV
jgi:hypothetical protein